MKQYDQEVFNQFVVENGVIGFFDQPIKLKSGRTSKWYVNWRSIASDAYLMDQLTDYIITFIKHLNLKPDCIYGVPEGATKTAVLTSYKWAKQSKDFKPHSHALTMGRAQPKEHGLAEDRFFVGAPRGSVLVLEDVTTTGGSLFSTVERLLDAKITVGVVLSLTDRMEKTDEGLTVAETFQKKYGKKIPYYSMSQAPDLLPKIK